MITEDETERLYDQLDACIQKAKRLRASHAALLAAAKEALRVIEPDTPYVRARYEELQAAIAAAEKLGGS